MKKRNTWQKEVILNVLKDNKVHPTINELYEIIKKEHNIGKATVYRNINEMVEEGKVRKLASNDIYHYDGNTTNHYHLVCKECNKIIDIFDETVNNITQTIEKEQKIVIDQMHIVIDGLCSLCKNKREGR